MGLADGGLQYHAILAHQHVPTRRSTAASRTTWRAWPGRSGPRACRVSPTCRPAPAPTRPTAFTSTAGRAPSPPAKLTQALAVATTVGEIMLRERPQAVQLATTTSEGYFGLWLPALAGSSLRDLRARQRGAAGHEDLVAGRPSGPGERGSSPRQQSIHRLGSWRKRA